MSSSSSSRTVPSMDREEIEGEINIKCKCGLKCKRWTSWTEKNPCRRFLRCPSFKGSQKQCNYFSWLDPEMEHNWYKTNMYHMHLELVRQKRDNSLEYQLKDANERNSLLDLELKEANEQKMVLEYELKEAKKNGCLYCSVMVIVLIVNFALIWN